MGYMAKSSWLVTISGIIGTWDTQDGGGGSSEPIQHFRGGEQTATIIGTKPKFDDITVTRLFGDGHLAIFAALTKKIGNSKHMITKQATDINGIRKGKPITYKNCVLKKVEYPPYDANATEETSIITLVFSTNGPA